MQQRVRMTPSWTMSFVCQTTPHFDSTSREASYSVHAYLTRKQEKCKSLFFPFPPAQNPGCISAFGVLVKIISIKPALLSNSHG